MWKRDYRDVAAGAFFVLTGGFGAIYAAFNYRLGDFGAMGPGMFPVIVGSIVALLGAGIVVPALFTRGERPHIDFRAAIAVLVGIAAFAAAARPLGLVPATFLLTGLSMFAQDRVSLRSVLILSLVLSALAYTIFTLGLGIALPAWRWPF